MKKPVIMCDLDGIVANLLAKFIKHHNAECGTTLTVEEVLKAEHMPPDLDRFLALDGYFKDLEVLHGFTKQLPQLQAFGNFHFCSTPSRNPDSASDKIRWVLERFPGFDREQIILIKHKWLLNGDIWFEDWGKNLIRIRQHHPKAFIGTFAYPYNVKQKDIVNIRVEHGEGAWAMLRIAAEAWWRFGR